MNSQLVSLSCEVELLTGEKLTLPDDIVSKIGVGRWLVSIVPVTLPITPIRQHDAFLSSYAPEDEGLYDDYSAR
jgi:hypothetical protein